MSNDLPVSLGPGGIRRAVTRCVFPGSEYLRELITKCRLLLTELPEEDDIPVPADLNQDMRAELVDSAQAWDDIAPGACA